MNDQPNISNIFASLKDGLLAQELIGKFLATLIQNDIDPSPFVLALEDIESSACLKWTDFEALMTEPREKLVPTVGRVAGATPLLYRGKTNMIFGTDSVGKSLLSARIALQELEAGNRVVWIDYEEIDGENLADRFLDMGADPALGRNFKTMWTDRKLSNKDIQELVKVADGASLLVLDSIGVYLSIHNANENWDIDVATWLFQHFCNQILMSCEDPPAILFIDHQSKSSDGMTSAGSKRKRGGVSGAAYNISVPEGLEWSQHAEGSAKILCVKDRIGDRRRGDIAGWMHVRPRDENSPLAVAIDIDEPVNHMLNDEDDQSYAHSVQSKQELVDAFLRRPGLTRFKFNDIVKFVADNGAGKIAPKTLKSMLQEPIALGRVIQLDEYDFAMPGMMAVDSDPDD